VLPSSVQIITWNDFGESSYISDVVGRQVVSGAEKYVNGYNHAAYRAVLPYFVKAYKAGQKNVALPFNPTAIAWYRTTPARLGWDGGTIWGQGGSQSAANGAKDVVSIMTVTGGETDVKVCIASSCSNFKASGANRVNYFEMPFDGRTGAVSLTMNGKTTNGPSITNNMPSTGYINFNSVAIQL
jgi:glucan endo-1,3-alpha-glucosidase